ncbi:MAG: 6-phospho-alpha-glucosidase, partial [Butyricicoccus sp.]
MRKNKFVIVGSGSSYTPAIVAVLLARREELKLHEISLYDIDASRAARTGEFCQLYAK